MLSFALRSFQARWSTTAEGEVGLLSWSTTQRLQVPFLSPFPPSLQERVGVRVQGQLQHFFAEAEPLTSNPWCGAGLGAVPWDGHSPVSGATGGHGKYQDYPFLC